MPALQIFISAGICAFSLLPVNLLQTKPNRSWWVKTKLHMAGRLKLIRFFVQHVSKAYCHFTLVLSAIVKTAHINVKGR